MKLTIFTTNRTNNGSGVIIGPSESLYYAMVIAVPVICLCFYLIIFLLICVISLRCAYALYTRNRKKMKISHKSETVTRVKEKKSKNSENEKKQKNTKNQKCTKIEESELTPVEMSDYSDDDYVINKLNPKIDEEEVESNILNEESIRPNSSPNCSTFVEKEKEDDSKKPFFERLTNLELNKIQPIRSRSPKNTNFGFNRSSNVSNDVNNLTSSKEILPITENSYLVISGLNKKWSRSLIISQVISRLKKLISSPKNSFVRSSGTENTFDFETDDNITPLSKLSECCNDETPTPTSTGAENNNFNELVNEKINIKRLNPFKKTVVVPECLITKKKEQNSKNLTVKGEIIHLSRKESKNHLQKEKEKQIFKESQKKKFGNPPPEISVFKPVIFNQKKKYFQPNNTNISTDEIGFSNNDNLYRSVSSDIEAPDDDELSAYSELSEDSDLNSINKNEEMIFESLPINEKISVSLPNNVGDCKSEGLNRYDFKSNSFSSLSSQVEKTESVENLCNLAKLIENDIEESCGSRNENFKVEKRKIVSTSSKKIIKKGNQGKMKKKEKIQENFEEKKESLTKKKSNSRKKVNIPKLHLKNLKKK